eukprot:4568263-Alexandrium_andersonii.AAC.1
MSASLVGSEMCIRDRCSAVQGRSAPYLESTLADMKYAIWERIGDAPPVSYTHLTLPTICSV